MVWLDGFKYRRIAGVLVGQEKPLVDYPVRIELRYGSGSLLDAISNNCIYLEGCKPDFSDVVIAADGVILAPKKDNYWIEEKVDGSHMIVWVKVPFVPARAEKEIYVYFGKTTHGCQRQIGV